MSNRADLPDDIELLKALLVEARSLLAERDVEIEQLKAQIDKLRRMQFGRKSEQLQRQIETLETQLEDLAAGRGVVDAYLDYVLAHTISLVTKSIGSTNSCLGVWPSVLCPHAASVNVRQPTIPAAKYRDLDCFMSWLDNGFA